MILKKAGYTEIPTLNRENTKATQKIEIEKNSSTSEKDTDDTTIKRLCETLRKNISIDMNFWRNANLEFKCYLVPAYASLSLNFEIKNINGRDWGFSNGEITVKAHIYDHNKNLINISENIIYDEDVKRNRVSDSIYFDYDEIQEGKSIEVYAFRTE